MLEHSNEIYFPTLIFSAKSRAIERKRLEQIRTDLELTPKHQLCATLRGSQNPAIDSGHYGELVLLVLQWIFQVHPA